MSRDGMPRAYLRIDPNLDQHPDPLGMVLLLCAGARQAERGHFRDRTVVVRSIGVARTKALIARHDIVQLADGEWYIEGWDEWQEGDHTVAERMKRMRARRAKSRSNAVSPVTVEASPPSIGVTTDAVRDNSNVSPSGDDDDVEPPTPTSGGNGSRSNGTNPRAIARRLEETRRQEAAERKERIQRIRLRYLRGELTESQRDAEISDLVPS